MSTLPLFVIIPLGTAFVLPLLWKLPQVVKDFLALAATAALAVLAVLQVGQGPSALTIGGWEPMNGIPVGVQMRVDGLSMLLLLVVNVLAFFAAFYSVRYMDRYTEKVKYWTLFLLMVAGMNGVVLSGDLFNMYVFLEVAALASYALVAFGTEAEQLEASFKYQVMGSIGSACILLAIALLYALTGTLNLADLGAQLQTVDAPWTLLFLQVLLIVGFGLKAAQVPFHAWLPDAHPSAPAPISALLSGVLIKSLGVYALARLFFTVIGITQPIAVVWMVLGSLSMVLGVLLAIGQNDLKRLLAYSSISQVGYVLLALGIGAAALPENPAAASLAFLGGLFHLVNHATFKALLFLGSGAIEHQTGTRNLDEMGGLRGPMPVTSFTGAVASFAIAGVPPFNGFWSKLLIIIAAVQAGYWGLAAVAALVAILTLATFLKVQGQAWWGALPAKLGTVREASAWMLAPMVVLALLCVLLGLLVLEPLRPLLLDPAVEVLKGGVSEYVRGALGN